MTATLRAATLTNFETTASDCGIDARRLIAEVGLPVKCLDDPDLMLPAVPLGALLELASQRSGELAFGLRMAATRRISNLGPLGLLVREQPTLRHALEAVVAHIHKHNEAFLISIERSGSNVSIREETILEGTGPMRQAVELAMGTTFRVLTLFLGNGWHPKRVSFRHGAPPATTWHRDVFGCPVRFDQEFNEIVCQAADLESPNPSADPVMARYAGQFLEKEYGANALMGDKVRRLVVLLLPHGHCRVDIVAQHLGVHRKTIANRLAQEHTTFSAIVDAMRRDLLSQFIKDGSRSLSDVSVLLGFSELSAFSRWHRAQYGVSARDRRGPLTHDT